MLPPGVGKSHLAIALGIKACEQGVRTLFIAATALITTLGKALAEGKLDERLKLLTQAQLLLWDELGYLPDRQGANLFFQLVSRRYEQGVSRRSLGFAYQCCRANGGATGVDNQSFEDIEA